MCWSDEIRFRKWLRELQLLNTWWGKLFHCDIVCGKNDRRWEVLLHDIGRKNCSCTWRDLLLGGRSWSLWHDGVRLCAILYNKLGRVSTRLCWSDCHPRFVSMSIDACFGIIVWQCPSRRSALDHLNFVITVALNSFPRVPDATAILDLRLNKAQVCPLH